MDSRENCDDINGRVQHWRYNKYEKCIFPTTQQKSQVIDATRHFVTTVCIVNCVTPSAEAGTNVQRILSRTGSRTLSLLAVKD